jgi:hypothetical protein
MTEFPGSQQIGGRAFVPLPTTSDLSVASFEYALSMLKGDAQELACNEHGAPPEFFDWMRETHPGVTVTFIPEGEMGHPASWWLGNNKTIVYSKW